MVFKMDYRWTLILLSFSVAYAETWENLLIHFPDQVKLTSQPRTTLIKKLTTQNAISSERILNFLAKHPRSVKEIKPLWITNSLRVQVTPQIAALLRGMNSLADVVVEEPKIISSGTLDPATIPAPPPEKSWALSQYQIDKVWQAGAKGKGVLIALIDTGTNINHPDLRSSVWKNPGEIAGNLADDDRNGYIDDISGWNFMAQNGDVADTIGHGTLAAGVLVGRGNSGIETGVAPEANLMVLKTCCDRGGEIFESRTWEAMQYALQNGAQIISMSLSIKHFAQPSYDKWRRASEVLLAAGILLVDSAGNYGTGAAPHNLGAPASNPPAWLHPSQPTGGLSSNLTIGALLALDRPYPSSSTGPVTWEDTSYADYPVANGNLGLLKPDLCGPSGIPSTSKDGKSYVKNFEGTSAATPFIAGAIALLLSLKSGLTPEQLTEALQMTASPIGRTFNNQCGAGKLQLEKAWAYTQKKF